MTVSLYNVDHLTTVGPIQIKTFVAFKEADVYIRRHYSIVHYEIDNEHIDCADFVTDEGTLYMIEPTRPA